MCNSVCELCGDIDSIMVSSNILPGIIDSLCEDCYGDIPNESVEVFHSDKFAKTLMTK